MSNTMFTSTVVLKMMVYWIFYEFSDRLIISMSFCRFLIYYSILCKYTITSMLYSYKLKVLDFTGFGLLEMKITVLSHCVFLEYIQNKHNIPTTRKKQNRYDC